MNTEVIRTEEEYQAALARIWDLMGAMPGTSEGAELNALVGQVKLYEDRQESPDMNYDTVLQLRVAANTMRSIIMERLGPCREASLALTKVDEALMWATGGVLK